MTTAALRTVAAPATAQTLYFGLGVTTDYLSRGASQTGGCAALQPWVEYETNGFYVGAWASNVDLAPDSVGLDLLAIVGRSRTQISTLAIRATFITAEATPVAKCSCC